MYDYISFDSIFDSTNRDKISNDKDKITKAKMTKIICIDEEKGKWNWIDTEKWNLYSLYV